MGWTGVDLFFVLSGFLITTILVEARGKPHSFRNFYVRRVLRILPLYYLVVALAFYVFPHLGSVGRDLAATDDKQWPYWLHVANYHMASMKSWPSHCLQVTWSLSIEEQYYLVWPFAMLVLPRRLLIPTCLALIATAVAIRTVAVMTQHGGLMLYAALPSRMDSLAMGGLIALLALDGIAKWKRAALIVLPISMIALAGIFLRERVLFWTGGVGQCIGYTLLALVSGCVVILALCSDPDSRLAQALSFDGLTVCGRLSYCMYLTHVPIIAALAALMFEPGVGSSSPPMFAGSIWLGQLIFIVMSMMVSLGVAWVSWNVFERHFLAIKRFFPMPRVAA